jgi:hypothetical protein
LGGCNKTNTTCLSVLISICIWKYTVQFSVDFQIGSNFVFCDCFMLNGPFFSYIHTYKSKTMNWCLLEYISVVLNCICRARVLIQFAFDLLMSCSRCEPVMLLMLFYANCILKNCTTRGRASLRARTSPADSWLSSKQTNKHKMKQIDSNTEQYNNIFAIAYLRRHDQHLCNEKIHISQNQILMLHTHTHTHIHIHKKI